MKRTWVVLCVAILLAEPVWGKKFDVGGHRLRAVQRGKGTPTVLFDSGLGDTHEVWRWVWPGVAKFTGVLLYDRAGIGRSDDGPAPRTSAQIVRELRALLQAAEVPGPYVLVGHSFGGLNMRLFASEYPEDVVALILIDATPVDFPEREPELRSELERTKLETVLALSSNGARLEMASVRRSAEQIRTAVPPDVPVTVVSSSRPEEPGEFRAAWFEMQQAMAARLAADHHVITDRSGHYVQFDEPQLVIDLIRRAVEQARSPIEAAAPGSR